MEVTPLLISTRWNMEVLRVRQLTLARVCPQIGHPATLKLLRKTCFLPGATNFMATQNEAAPLVLPGFSKFITLFRPILTEIRSIMACPLHPPIKLLAWSITPSLLTPQPPRGKRSKNKLKQRIPVDKQREPRQKYRELLEDTLRRRDGSPFVWNARGRPLDNIPMSRSSQARILLELRRRPCPLLVWPPLPRPSRTPKACGRFVGWRDTRFVKPRHRSPSSSPRARPPWGKRG